MDYELMQKSIREDAILSWHQDHMEIERAFMEQALEDIPMEWFEEEFTIPLKERKVRLTLYVDESVAKVFRKHVNWQEIMRGVLRAYVRAKQEKLMKNSKPYYEAWLKHVHAKRQKRLEAKARGKM